MIGVFSRHPYFMLNQYDIDLLAKCQLKSFQNFLPILKHCDLIVNCQDSKLIIRTDNPNAVSLLKWQQEFISTQAYIKLGCRQIALYLQSSCLISYDTNVSAASLDNTMTFTIDRPTEVQEATTEVRESAGAVVASVSNWYSFTDVADKMAEVMSVNLSDEEVAERVEQYKIPCRLYQGRPGLEKQGVRQFLAKYIAGFSADILNKLDKNKPVRNTRGTRRSSTPDQPDQSQKVVSINSATEGNSTEVDFSLPSNFEDKMMDGRKRKPDIQTGLRLAIAELSGISQRDALTAIAFNQPQAETFINDLAQVFKSNSRSHSKAMQEIADAAVVLLRSGEAA